MIVETIGSLMEYILLTKFLKYMEFFEKKKRGRPRKHPIKEIDPEEVKRGRGRPRKHPIKEKKKRGRKKSPPIELVCERCHKDFIGYNRYFIKIGKHRFCSSTCKKQLYTLDDSYFSDMSDESKFFTLGQIVATSHIVDYRRIRIFSNELTMLDIRSKLGMNHPYRKSMNGLYRLEVCSERMVSDLVGLGMNEGPFSQEMFDSRMLEGVISTYMIEGDNRVFRTDSSKLAREVSYLSGGLMVEEWWKDVARGGGFCCWWKVYF